LTKRLSLDSSGVQKFDAEGMGCSFNIGEMLADGVGQFLKACRFSSGGVTGGRFGINRPGPIYCYVIRGEKVEAISYREGHCFMRYSNHGIMLAVSS